MHKTTIQLLDDVDPSAIADLRVLQYNSTSGKHVYVTPSSITGGSTGFATPAIVLGTAAAAGAATTAIRSDSTIIAFDSTAPSTQAIGDSAATGSVALAARRDHKHAITNPLTTKGDVWVGGASGAPSRLAVGSDGQVMTADSTQALGVKWATPASGFADPTTTKGDIIVHGTSTTRLGVGSDGQVLTADSAQTLGVKWATPSSGFSDPTTTKGDLIVHGSSTTRLGVGTDGQVLVADSTQTLGVKWGNRKTPAVHVRTESGNITCNGTSWANLNTAWDITIAAVAGDILEVALSAVWGNGATSAFLDVVSVVSAAPVNSFADAAAPNNTHNGIATWSTQGSAFVGVGGTTMYTVVSGDISGGNVLCRLRVRTGSAVNQTFFASSGNPMDWSVKNLGQ